MNYDVSDHMPVVCETVCEKIKTETFNQKYVQEFSTFDVWVFLNNFRIKVQNIRFYAKFCEDVNRCWVEFKAIFSGMVYHNALMKFLNKKNKN